MTVSIYSTVLVLNKYPSEINQGFHDFRATFDAHAWPIRIRRLLCNHRLYLLRAFGSLRLVV